MRKEPWEAMMRMESVHGRSYWILHPAVCEEILEGIANGVPVEYVGSRVRRFGRNLPIRPQDRPKVSAVIAADVAALKKAGPFDREPFPDFNISPIGCVPKKNASGAIDPNKVRVIHHLSFPHGGDSVNASIPKKDESLPSFGHAARAVARLGRDTLLIKLDVSAAYKQIPVRKEDWPLLGFLWEHKYYYERVLPFGLRSSCRLWELYAAALHFFLSEHSGVRCAHEVFHYVDDFLFLVEPGREEEAERMLKFAVEMCARLGLPIAPDKTEGPVTMLTFLGIELDTQALEARLPAPRLAEIQRVMVEWGTRPEASTQELQSIGGLLNFACAVVPPGRYFTRRIFNLIKMREASGLARKAQIKLPDEVRKDFAWWSEFLPRFNGTSMLYEAEWTRADKIQLATDACDTGFGGHWGHRWFEGPWPPSVWGEATRGRRTRSMPFLELYALVTAALLWGKQWRSKKVIFLCDCRPIVQAVEKSSSKSESVMHLLRLLCATACDSGFDFKVEHIAGVTNIIPDLLSRYGDCPQFRAACPGAYRRPQQLPLVPLPLPAAEPVQPKPRDPPPRC